MKIFIPKPLPVILVAAILFRIGFFVFTLQHVPPSADEAWPALMGLHILKGEFPVFYWGQAYMGAHQAYFDAALYPFLGCNVATTRLYPLLFSFLFLLASAWLARTVYDRTTGIITLALLAVPVPYLAMCGAISVPPEYLAVATLGSLALTLVARIVFADAPARLGPMTLLGFILGFAFWLHLVALSVIGVALLFLFLKDKLFLFRPAFWAGALAFLCGSLPFWAYNLAHGFETFGDVGRTIDWTGSLMLLRAAFGITLHVLVGMKVMLYGDSRHILSLPTPLAIALGLVWIGLILLVIISRFKGLIRLAMLSVKSPVSAGAGTGMLLAMAVAVLFLFCRSARAGWADARFLVPMLSVLPVLLACGLAQVRTWSRPLFAALLAFIIGCQAWGNMLLVQAWSDPHMVGETLDLPDTGALHRFLKQQDIRHAYAHYWISYRLTFESQEELICSEPYNERFPGREVKYIDEVRAADRVAYITHPKLYFAAENFDTLLQRIGGKYRKQAVGCFTVYYDFKPPYGNLGLREITREGWVVTTDWNPQDAGQVADGDPSTVWESRRPQTAGMWLTVDLGREATVCNIRFDLGRNITDYPRGYKVETSTDGNQWTHIGEIGDVGQNLFWEGAQPWFLVRGDHFNAAFPPVPARFVKITLTADDPQARWWWAIAEIRIFGPDLE